MRLFARACAWLLLAATMSSATKSPTSSSLELCVSCPWPVAGANNQRNFTSSLGDPGLPAAFAWNATLSLDAAVPWPQADGVRLNELLLYGRYSAGDDAALFGVATLADEQEATSAAGGQAGGSVRRPGRGDDLGALPELRSTLVGFSSAGSPLWHTRNFTGLLAVTLGSDDRAFVGTRMRSAGDEQPSLSGVSTRNGSLLWHRGLGAPCGVRGCGVASVMIFESLVFAALVDGAVAAGAGAAGAASGAALVALHAEDGSDAFEVDGVLLASAHLLSIPARPEGGNDALVVAAHAYTASPHALYVAAFDMSGRRVWRTALPGAYDGDVPVALSADLDPPAVYVSVNNSLHRLDPSNGALVWTVGSQLAPLSPRIPVRLGISRRHTLVMSYHACGAYEQETGKLAWHLNASDTDWFNAFAQDLDTTYIASSSVAGVGIAALDVAGHVSARDHFRLNQAADMLIAGHGYLALVAAEARQVHLVRPLRTVPSSASATASATAAAHSPAPSATKSPSPSPRPSNPHHGISAGEIAGIACACVAVAGSAVGFVVWRGRMCRRKQGYDLIT